MSHNYAKNDDTESLYKFVPLDKYNLPPAPVTENMRKGVIFFRGLFKKEQNPSPSILNTEDDLKFLPENLLNRVAPKPDWESACLELENELSGWLEKEISHHPVIAIIHPPNSGQEEILTIWAREHNWQVLEPPSPSQVFSREPKWLSSQLSEKKPFVLPALERYYFRHTKGLALVRWIMDKAWSGELGRAIIGCDSWAWAFLRHIWGGQLPVTLSLQGFDRNKLAELFLGLSNNAFKNPLLFRQSDTGQYILQPPENVEEAEMSNYLKLLASYSRGNAGIALAYWRSSLQKSPDKWKPEEEHAENGHNLHKTIWLTPWDDLYKPKLPSNAGLDECFVLHMLLIHNGLNSEMLQEILSLPSSQILELLLRLEGKDLVSREGDSWKVAPLGYPAVRQFLISNGFFADAL